MSTQTVLKDLFQYDSDMWEFIWRIVEELPLEAFEAPVAYSVGSIRDQLAHLASVNTRWFMGLQGVPNAINYAMPVESLATREAIHATWRKTEDEIIDFVNGVNDATLEETLPEMAGPTWQVLFHLVNHSTDHRAQTLRLLNDAGARTPPQDYIFWAWKFGPWRER